MLIMPKSKILFNISVTYVMFLVNVMLISRRTNIFVRNEDLAMIYENY